MDQCENPAGYGPTQQPRQKQFTLLMGQFQLIAQILERAQWARARDYTGEFTGCRRPARVHQHRTAHSHHGPMRASCREAALAVIRPPDSLGTNDLRT
jgi:hypothetical protein